MTINWYLPKTRLRSLSVTYDGSTAGITVIGVADDWEAILPQNITLFNTSHQWQEPQNPNYLNFVLGGGNQLAQVFSDRFDPNNGFPSDGHTYVGAGEDSSDLRFIDVTFHDLGDTVPDTGTTASLFGLSLMGLAFLRRKVC